MLVTRKMTAALAAAALVGLLAGATPAAASANSQPVLSASAFWTTHHPNGGVSVQVDEQHGKHPPGGLFLFVTQQFCDATHDQMVFRSFLSNAPLSASQVFVDRHLRAALVDAHVTVSGTEQRLHGCASPSGTPQTTDLGNINAEIDAGWLATGPVRNVQPGIVARDAHAFALLKLGHHASVLGLSDTAELRRTDQS
jgi:hypothetical protein